MQHEIQSLWSELMSALNKDPKDFSSEKTMVFKFAWLLKERLGIAIHKLDFEKQVFEKEFMEAKYLDLYFEFEGKRIGLEFKFPKYNGGYTNQTQTRVKIVNDLKRLNYLVNSNKIDIGIFLMATDLKPYVIEGKKQKYPDFKTYKDVKYAKVNDFPIAKENEFVIKPNNDICFNWFNDNRMRQGIEFAWLEPIFINRY